MRDDARRLGMLAAMGIEVYGLREPDTATIAGDHALPAPAGVSPRLIVAARGGQRGDVGAALARMVRALGVGAADVGWVDADALPAGQLPGASAYLLVGAQAARRISAHLSIEHQRSATIAVIDDPVSPHDAAARRAQWQSLKPLARRLQDG